MIEFIDKINVFLKKIIDLFVIIIIYLLIQWNYESELPIIYQITKPKVIEVTNEYIDVEWHNKRLLNCPTVGTPILYTSGGIEQMPTRPVASNLEEQRFIRRYSLSNSFIDLYKKNNNKNANAELRILIESKCNPIWTNQELIRVPFKMPY